VIRKKRCTFMIEPEVLERLQSITARTGLSKSEQIRQGIRWWLESREWPLKSDQGRDVPHAAAALRPRGSNGRRRPRTRR
jgi:Ribbon-helix-helix domain